MKHYTESHEWIELNGKAGTVGVTHYAQNELGEIVYIELPKLGLHVKAGQEVAVLESTKAAADVYAPMSGKIIAVNEALRENPASINQSPESASWLFQIEITHPKELDHLLTEQRYQALIAH
ncbi:MAG: glycine cleavage system protein GcvH [Chlamydiales bacterium]